MSNGKSMELIKHKHTFASYMQRVDVMRKEEANQGWYAAALLEVKKKWDLEDGEEMGGETAARVACPRLKSALRGGTPKYAALHQIRDP